MNPYDNLDAYRVVVVGPVTLPGHVTAIDGCDLEYAYDVAKPVAKGGADNKFKGKEVAKDIKVTCHLRTTGHFLDLADVRAKLRVAKGAKAPAHDVRNAIFNENGITSVQVKKLGQEKHLGGGLWEVVFEFLENDPSKSTATGKADGSKPATGDSKGKFVDTPQKSDADKEIDNLLNKAKEP